MVLTTDPPEKALESYASARATYVTYAEKLGGLLKDLLRAHGIEMSSVEWRAKDIASLRDKLERKGRRHENLLQDITDLVGVRIICHYVEDVATVSRMIQEEFSIDVGNSIDKRAVLATDQFGYLSSHFVVSLAASRANLAEWRSFSGIKAEIQVRTILQHAWAAISHKLTYKSTEDVPTLVMRETFRLSALLELADQEFSRLRDQVAEIRSSYDIGIARGQIEVELNLDSLNEYMKSSGELMKWQRLAVSAGAFDVDRSESTLLLDETGRKRLFHLLRTLGIPSLKGLADALSSAVAHAPRNLARIYQLSTQRGYPTDAWAYDEMAAAIAVSRAADLPSDFKMGYLHSELEEALGQAIAEARKKTRGA